MEQQRLGYKLYFSHFSGGLGSRLEAVVLCNDPGASDSTHLHPRFRKHPKTKLRTQPCPACICPGFQVPAPFPPPGTSVHIQDAKQMRQAWGPCLNTHTPFPDKVLPIWAGAAWVSTAGTCLAKYPNPYHSALCPTM